MNWDYKYFKFIITHKSKFLNGSLIILIICFYDLLIFTKYKWYIFTHTLLTNTIYIYIYINEIL